MNKDDKFLGIVENSKLKLLLPENLAGTSFRLIGARLQEAILPESREINLIDYEGEAIILKALKVGSGFTVNR